MLELQRVSDTTRITVTRTHARDRRRTFRESRRVMSSIIYIFVSRIKKAPLLVEVARARESHHLRARETATKSGVLLSETKI